ncbi:CaiB/BaiF CoA transferase family protein [Brevibacillus marinus]|uniref:CaiB/BaiF CoA transferase family protein n=1 Tax=Brevibacillus marinus TaxID=2496837 RepID=UPI000F8250CD|nr:CoA transferase [Brevibacillus marinus]
MAFQPLAGVKVIDWTEGVAGPYACQIMSDLGAEIIKVERPDGDWGRTMGIGEAQFAALNRNKRSICLDLKQPESREIAWALLKHADIMVTSYRPGVMERLGLGFEQVHRDHPQLIYGRISAFGYHGKLASRPGSDTVLQAVSGFMSQIGDADGEPYRVGIPIIDLVAARDLVIGILAVHLARMQGEAPRHPVDVSLFASFAALQAQSWQQFLATGESPKRTGNRNPLLAPAGVYQSRDDKYFSIVVLREEQWARFCTALGLPELLEDPQFRTNELRIVHRQKLESILHPLFRSRRRDEWIDLFQQHDLLIAPVLDFAEIAADSDLMEAIPMVPLPTDGGVAIGLPISFGQAQAAVRYAPPAKGEHTREIMSEIGFPDAEIDRYLAKGILWEAKL